MSEYWENTWTFHFWLINYNSSPPPLTQQYRCFSVQSSPVPILSSNIVNNCLLIDYERILNVFHVNKRNNKCSRIVRIQLSFISTKFNN